MRKVEQIRVLKGLMAHLDAGTNVDAGHQLLNPVSGYTCPDIAAREWQSFFQAYPQILGLSDDLPENQSFFTSSDLGKPILCTRDNDGLFHAFLNVCRHRGSIVETEQRGKRNLFSCPFHAWSYSTAGDLISVPKEEQFGSVDKACHGLVELPAEEKHGLLWVQLDQQGELNLDRELGALGDELASWQLDRFKFKSECTYTHDMNWKLAIDTFGETYHFNVLHKDTLANDFYGNVQMYDEYEKNHRMSLCMKSIEALRSKPESEWDILDGVLPVYYLFPNTILIQSKAGPTLVRVYPVGDNPDHSYSQISFYLPPEILALAGNEDTQELYDFVEDRVNGFASVIEQEDYRVAASSHVGALSGAQEYITFGRNEPALHHYHSTYRQLLDLPPLKVVGE